MVDHHAPEDGPPGPPKGMSRTRNSKGVCVPFRVCRMMQLLSHPDESQRKRAAQSPHSVSWPASMRQRRLVAEPGAHARNSRSSDTRCLRRYDQFRSRSLGLEQLRESRQALQVMGSRARGGQDNRAREKRTTEKSLRQRSAARRACGHGSRGSMQGRGAQGGGKRACEHGITNVAATR